ncbi:hypothetical protein ACOMHN_017411 [Nucella lapillus]
MENFNQFSYGESEQGIYGQTFGPISRDAIALVKENIIEAVDSIPDNLKEGGPFTIADYGAADGFASMPLIKELIEVVRKKHGEIPVQVVYEDQASSDFNSLFRLVYGVIPDPYHYFSKFRDVFMMATGTSFYEQILPANSAHLIMSFMAAQYLSKPTVKFQNSLERFPAATEAEAQLELKAGGVLILSMPATDPEGKLQGVRHTIEGYIEAMLKVRRQMRDEGKITQEEFVDTNFYRCMYYSKELKVPFEDPESKVSKAGLRLSNMELAFEAYTASATNFAKRMHTSLKLVGTASVARYCGNITASASPHGM